MTSVNLITLKCSNCSASLELSDQLSRFICNYCGTEQMLVHGADGYFFKRLEDRLESLEKATEKGNIELALKRLREDLQLKMVQHEAVSQERKKVLHSLKREQSDIYQYLVILAGVQISVLYADITFTVYFLLQLAIMTGLSRLMHHTGEIKNSRKDLEKKYDSDLEVIKSEIETLELKIRKRKRKVDDDS